MRFTLESAGTALALLFLPSPRTLVGLTLLCGATAAFGDAIVNLDAKLAGASILQADADGNFIGKPQFMEDFEPNSGLDFSGSASAAYNDMGFVGSASSTWDHAYNPSDPGLGGAFSTVHLSGSAGSNSTSDGFWSDQLSAFGSTVVYFSIVSDTLWTFDADVEGTTSGAGSLAYFFFVFNEESTVQYGEASGMASSGESLNDSLHLSGVIPAGNYLFSMAVGAFQSYEFASGSGSASIELTNGVFTIPEPSTAALLGIAALALCRRRGC